MFGSRRHQRAPHPQPPPLTAATANPNAATAAAAVFRRHESNSQLSAAASAAAAALRARPTTPINVANVQTKRTLRRSASVASSATAGSDTNVQLPPAAGLQRRNSSSSMAERTFRTPSPHGPRPGLATTAGGPGGRSPRRSLSTTDIPPPVPAIPSSVNAAATTPTAGVAVDAKQQTSASSPRLPTSTINLQTGGMNPPVRVASQKLASGDAPGWFTGARVGDLSAIRRTDPAMASPPASQPSSPKIRHSRPQLQSQIQVQPQAPEPTPTVITADQNAPSSPLRPVSSSSSINFSYPTRVRRASSAAAAAAAVTTNGAGFPAVGEGGSSTGNIPYIQQPQHQESQQQPQQISTDSKTRSRQPARQGSRDLALGGASTATTPTTAAKPSVSDQTLVYDPNSRRMVRQAELLAVEQVQASGISGAPQPSSQHLTGSVPRKKRRSRDTAGTHLAAGTMRKTARAAETQQPKAQVAPGPVPGAATVQEQRAVMVDLPENAAVRRDGEVAATKAVAGPGTGTQIALQEHLPMHVPEPVQVDLPKVYVPPTTVVSSVGVLAMRRKPSVVEEVSEPETDEDKQLPKPSAALDAASPVPRGPEVLITQPPATPQNHASQRSLFDTSTISHANVATSVNSSFESKSPPSELPIDRSRAAHVSRERNHSNSPVRQAHFGPVQQNLTVRHSPPPRSVSPRKSALKHHASPPGGSPSAAGDNASETSDQIPAPPARKKSVRVSFCDDSGDGGPGDSAAVAVGGDHSANSSPSSSHSSTHHSKHSWLSSLTRGRGRRGRHHDDDGHEHDDDIVMTPRPALPSFGSVRDRKPRDPSPERVQERPLVRPRGEIRWEDTPVQSNHAHATKSGAALLPSPSLGVSNDHAIGAALVSTGIGKEKEKEVQPWSLPQHAPNEPLPPVVTSVEGTGFLSDSSDTESLVSSVFEPQSHVDVEVPQETTTTIETGTQPRAFPLVSKSSRSTSQASADSTSSTGAVTEKATTSLPTVEEPAAVPPPEPQPEPELKPQVPALSVSAPTPVPTTEADVKPVATVRDSLLPDVPGGFPEDEPAQPTTKPAAAATTDAAQPPPQVPKQDTDSDSSSEVWSDAYEDLSEVEGGGGFLSLDAVVESAPQKPVPAQGSGANADVGDGVPKPESPVQTQGQKGAQKQQQSQPQPQPAPVASHSQQRPAATTLTPQQSQPPPPQPIQVDWEQAKAFLRSLSAEKRAQLQREALEEAGIEADKDTEAEVERDPKPRKKKSIERRNSERRALAALARMEQEQKQQQQQAQQQKGKATTVYDSEQDSVTAEQPPSVVPLMRKTMRREEPQRPAAVAAPSDGPKLRKSMRSGDSPRKTRDRSTSAPPVSLITLQATHPKWSITQAQQQTIPEISAPAVQPPPLTRRGSTGSESSFKRSRLSKGQGFGFRQSLRQPSPVTVQDDAARPTKRFSLRSASPASTASPPANTTGMHLRTTLRDPSPTPARPTSLRMPSFGLSGKKKAKQNKRSSRFADSSDDDDDAGVLSSGFRSRFEDSSDDEVEEPLTPAPATGPSTASELTYQHQQLLLQLRSGGSVASTALPEELEESEESAERAAADPAKRQINPVPQPAQPVVDTTVAAGTNKNTAVLRRARSGRGSLLARVASNASTTTPAAVSTLAPQPGVITSLPAKDTTTRRRGSFLSALRPRKHRGGIERPQVSESAARRDTKLERSPEELEKIRRLKDGDFDDDRETVESPTSPAKSPKLKKRDPRLAGKGGLARSPSSATGSVSVGDAGPAHDVAASNSDASGGNNNNNNDDARQTEADLVDDSNFPGKAITTGTNILHDDDDGGRVYTADNSPFASPSRPPRRVTIIGANTSSNLGTRTLSSSSSSGGGGGGGGRFLHLHMKSLGFHMRRSSLPQQPQQQPQPRRVNSMTTTGTITTITASPSASGGEAVVVPGGRVSPLPPTAGGTAAATTDAASLNMSMDGSVAGTGATGATTSSTAARRRRFGSIRRMFGMSA